MEKVSTVPEHIEREKRGRETLERAACQEITLFVFQQAMSEV